MLYLIIPVLICGVDLSLKHYIECNVKEGDRFEVLHGRILIQKTHNTGAMMNLLDNRRKLVAGFSLGIFVCIVIYYGYLLSKKGMHLMKFGLSFVTGGALSNVYDRLVRKYVVDYFSFNIKNERIKKVVFNIADIFIFIGSIFVILWNACRKS